MLVLGRMTRITRLIIVGLGLVAAACSGADGASEQTPSTTAEELASSVCARASAGDGLYCGGGQLRAGDPSTLYRCKSRRLFASTRCELGCTVEPAGKSDHCAVDPCGVLELLGNGEKKLAQLF